MTHLHNLKQFDKISTRFLPVRRDDLRPGAESLIGTVMTFQAAWIIEDGPYEGHWAMQVLDSGPLPFYWVPDVDLEFPGQG